MYERRVEPGVQLRDGVAQLRHHGERDVLSRADAPHEPIERLALDIFHHDAQVLARAHAFDQPGDVTQVDACALGAPQALVRRAHPRRAVDALAHVRAELPARRALEVHDIGRLEGRGLEVARDAPRVRAAELRQVGVELAAQVVGRCRVLGIHALYLIRRRPGGASSRSGAANGPRPAHSKGGFGPAGRLWRIWAGNARPRCRDGRQDGASAACDR